MDPVGNRPNPAVHKARENTERKHLRSLSAFSACTLSCWYFFLSLLNVSYILGGGKSNYLYLQMTWSIHIGDPKDATKTLSKLRVGCAKVAGENISSLLYTHTMAWLRKDFKDQSRSHSYKEKTIAWNQFNQGCAIAENHKRLKNETEEESKKKWINK